MAEINVEMDAAARSGGSESGAVVLGLTPLSIITPERTSADIITSVPPPITVPALPTSLGESISLDLSSEEEIDIMPSPEESPHKEKSSKRKTTGDTGGSSQRKKPKKKKE